MAITSVAIGSTNTTIFLSSGNNAITTVIVCNKEPFDSGTPTANTSLLTLYAVPNVGGVAGTPADVNLIVNELPIPAGETVTFDQEKMVLTTGDTLVAKANNTNLVVTVSTLPV